MSITDGLRVGDVVRHSRTMEVAFAAGGYVELHDTVAVGVRIGLYDSHKGSDKIEVVKKAKPSAGTVISGAELKATMWKRGTTVASASNPTDVYVLTADGSWISATTGRAEVQFRHFSDAYRLKLLHVA